MNKAVCFFFAVLVGGLSAMALEMGESAGPVALTTFEGHAFEMTNYGERPATVVVFLSARCEATERQIERINEVHARHRLRDVLFVGVCSNPAETGDELRTFAQRRGCNFPIYRDPEGKTARQFGATVTPEFFLLDKGGVLVYHGGLEGLDAAIKLAVARRAVEQAVTPVEGTPIDAPGPEREIDDRYGLLAFSSELVFEKAPDAAVHHCSTLAQAGNGDLVCLWYGGSYESAEDQVLFLARQVKGSRDWTPPEVVVRNPGQPPGNAVIFRDGLDRLWIVWGRMEASRPLRRGSGWGECSLLYRVSDDHGATWSADKEMPKSYGSLPRNVPITLRNGTLYLPLTGHVAGTSGSFFLETTDNGASWTASGVIPGGSQPTAIERDDGSLFVMMRHQPRILESVSTDGGATWSPSANSALRNPDAGIAMTRLANGHVVIVFNDSSIARSPLCIARSTDEGRTWEKPLDLESNPGEYSYPCVIQTADGLIHVSYTCRRWAIKHAAFNENWLTQFERPD